MKKIVCAASVTVLMLTGCFGTNTNNTTGSNLPNMPNVTPSTSPSASPSSAPNPAGPTPTSPASTTPSSTPASTTPSSTPASGGKLLVTNQDIFNKYNVEYRTGRKWVYSMKMPAINLGGLNIPGFGTTQFGNINIPGLNIPGLGSGSGSGSASGSGSSELGEFTMEVVKVDGNMVTVRTTVNMNENLPGGSSAMQDQEQTFPISEKSKLFSEMTQSAGTEGTLEWNRNPTPESVSVAGGNYTADKITGVMNVTSTQQGATANLKQDITTWIADGVGMVKQETKSNTAVSGGGASGSIDVGVTLELKSFSG
jgi:hypothetical protein